MSTKVREYKIKMPYSISDWRRAQRYVLARYTTEEVQIIGHKKRNEDQKAITETHKVLDLSKRLPAIIRKVLSGNASFVDEYSTNIDIINTAEMVKDVSSEREMRDTMIKTEKMKINEGPLEEVRIQEVKELREDCIDKNEATKGLEDPLMELRSENMSKDTIKDIDVIIRDEDKMKSKNIGDEEKTKDESIQDNTFSESFSESKYINRHYNTNTFHLTVKTYVRNKDEANIFGLPEGFKSKEIDLRGENPKDEIIVFKLVEVAVNSTFFGWVAEHIKNMMRDMLVKFQEKIIETEEEWMGMSEEELIRLEEEMIKNFLIK